MAQEPKKSFFREAFETISDAALDNAAPGINMLLKRFHDQEMEQREKEAQKSGDPQRSFSGNSNDDSEEVVFTLQQVRDDLRTTNIVLRSSLEEQVRQTKLLEKLVNLGGGKGGVGSGSGGAGGGGLENDIEKAVEDYAIFKTLQRVTSLLGGIGGAALAVTSVAGIDYGVQKLTESITGKKDVGDSEEADLIGKSISEGDRESKIHMDNYKKYGMLGGAWENIKETFGFGQPQSPYGDLDVGAFSKGFTPSRSIMTQSGALPAGVAPMPENQVAMYPGAGASGRVGDQGFQSQHALSRIAGGSLSPARHAAGQLSKNQSEAYDEFKKLGYSDESARVAVANLSGESLANPADTHADPSRSNPYQKAHGIASWDDARSARIQQQFGMMPNEMPVREQVQAWDWEAKNYYKPTYNALHDDKLTPQEKLSTVIGNDERPANVAGETYKRMGFFNGFNPTKGISEGVTLSSKPGAEAAAVDDMRKMLGIDEVRGNTLLRKYMKEGGVNMDPHEQAWCAAFVNAALGHQGIEGTGGNKLWAPDFAKWGQGIDDPNKAQKGDVLEYKNGQHVGLFTGDFKMENGRLMMKMIAGNEQNVELTRSGLAGPGRSQVGQVGEHWIPGDEVNIRRAFQNTPKENTSSPSQWTTTFGKITATPHVSNINAPIPEDVGATDVSKMIRNEAQGIEFQRNWTREQDTQNQRLYTEKVSDKEENDRQWAKFDENRIHRNHESAAKHFNEEKLHDYGINQISEKLRSTVTGGATLGSDKLYGDWRDTQVRMPGEPAHTHSHMPSGMFINAGYPKLLPSPYHMPGSHLLNNSIHDVVAQRKAIAHHPAPSSKHIHSIETQKDHDHHGTKKEVKDVAPSDDIVKKLFSGYGGNPITLA